MLRLLPEIRRRREARTRGAVETASDVLARFEGDWGVSLPPDSPEVLGEQHPRGDGRSLTVLSFVPMSIYPISHGGASRIMNTLWGLSRRGHKVHVLSLVETEAQAEAMRAMPEVASSHSFVLPLERMPWRGGIEPTVVAGSYRPAAARLLQEAVLRYRPDILLLEYTHSGAYISPALGTPTILVEHDVAYRSAFRSAMAKEGVGGKSRALFDVSRLYRWELETAKRADLVLSVSELEADVLRRRGVTRVCDAIPNGVDVPRSSPLAGRDETRDVLFVGYFAHPPNVDGLGFFVDEVSGPTSPRRGVRLGVCRRLGTLRGPSPPESTRRDSGDAAFVDAVPPNSGPTASSSVRSASDAGTRIKLLEAAAARCAIVSTTFGAEGLGLEDERDILLADDPAAFAAAVAAAPRGRGPSQTPRRRGPRDAVQRQFDWPALAERLKRVCYGLLDER